MFCAIEDGSGGISYRMRLCVACFSRKRWCCRCGVLRCSEQQRRPAEPLLPSAGNLCSCLNCGDQQQLSPPYILSFGAGRQAAGSEGRRSEGIGIEVNNRGSMSFCPKSSVWQAIGCEDVVPTPVKKQLILRDIWCRNLKAEFAATGIDLQPVALEAGFTDFHDLSQLFISRDAEGSNQEAMESCADILASRLGMLMNNIPCIFSDMT